MKNQTFKTNGESTIKSKKVGQRRSLKTNELTNDIIIKEEKQSEKSVKQKKMRINRNQIYFKYLILE